MTDPKPGNGELLIQLDVAGLAALMKAVETAMTDGYGHLALGSGAGTVVRLSDSTEPFGKVTVTFARPADPPDDYWRLGRPDPQPEPRLPAPALQD